MDRRKSLKIIVTGTLAGGAIATGCSPSDKKVEEVKKGEPQFAVDRYPEELKHEKAVLAEGQFFSAHDMATITLLADIIIPKDEISGSASD
ncbi:MAG TPA: hypothetical protein VK644_06775, partial [Chitinophagaceae bacterium]|nr:hypothetical protein [Chitinophagaceae bacterium]